MFSESIKDGSFIAFSSLLHHFHLILSRPLLIVMLQSQVLNVLPRRIVAGFWASQETRVSVSEMQLTTLPNRMYLYMLIVVTPV